MIRHLVGWRWQEQLNTPQKEQAAKLLQEKFAQLKDKIPGAEWMQLEINMLSTSAFDLVLNTVFATEEDLKAYQKNPDHKAVAAIVRTYTKDKTVIDFVEA